MINKISSMFILSLSLLVSCRPENGSTDSCSENERMSDARTKLVNVADPLLGTNSVKLLKPTFENTMEQSIATVKTVRVSWAVVHQAVEEVLRQTDFPLKTSRLKTLGKIVSDYPVDRSTPANRANSLLLRFTMEQEVFDGLVRLGLMNEAWTYLMNAVESYDACVSEARTESRHVNEKYLRTPNDESLREARNRAEEYRRCVESDCQCAIQRVKEYIIPNVRSKYGIPVNVETKIKMTLDAILTK